MHPVTRKLSAVALAAVGALSLTAGSAFAFECYNASRSDQGNAAAAKAPALISAEEALGMFCGLDSEAAAEVIAAMEADGFDMDFLINGQTLMAGGLERNPKHAAKLDDSQGIDHLSDEFFIALFTLVPECAGE